VVVTAYIVPSSQILSTLKMEAAYFSEKSVLTQLNVTISQKTAFFRVTTVKTSNPRETLMIAESSDLEFISIPSKCIQLPQN
jgi:hypothetical protein